MKKSIFFVALVAAALTFVSCGSKKEKEYKPYFPQTGWEEYGLKGKVKELHITESTSYDGDIENADEGCPIVVYFNEKGQIEKSTYNCGSDYQLYTYSGDTCLIETHHIDDEADEIFPYNVIVKDQRGNWTSLSVYDTDIVGDTLLNTIRHEYKYNEQGLLTEMLFYGNYSRPYSRYECSDHDENGFYHRITKYIDGGVLYDITILEGKDMMHCTKMVVMDKDGKSKEESSYEYNEYGFLTKMIGKDLIEGGEEVTEFTYKYDQKGNYIERIASDSMGHQTIEKRTIIYY